MFDLDVEPAVRTQLGMALVENPWPAPADDAVEHETAGRDADHRRVDELRAARGGRGNAHGDDGRRDRRGEGRPESTPHRKSSWGVGVKPADDAATPGEGSRFGVVRRMGWSPPASRALRSPTRRTPRAASP